MVVLHLLGNWKWTERAEPAALLARTQQAAGINVMFLCDRGPAEAEGTVADRVREFGLPVTAMNLSKHIRFPGFPRSIRELRREIVRLDPDIVHCHMPSTHLVAAPAICLLKKRPLLVRACYDPDAAEMGLRERLLPRRFTDAFVVICQKARRRIERLGFAPQRIAVIEPGIDLARFSPSAESRYKARQRWNLPSQGPVIGMVSRIRRQRRIDLGIRLLHELRNFLPQARLLLVGRGSTAEVRRAASEPASRLGLTERVIMTGYQAGADLAAAYHAMDIFFYPCAGTDRSCRAVREAMAAGLPVIAGTEGFLPELVTDNVTGRLSSLSPGSLADIVREMACDGKARQRMGAASLQEALARFDLDKQARRNIVFYRQLQRQK